MKFLAKVPTTHVACTLPELFKLLFFPFHARQGGKGNFFIPRSWGVEGPLVIYVLTEICTSLSERERERERESAVIQLNSVNRDPANGEI